MAVVLTAQTALIHLSARSRQRAVEAVVTKPPKAADQAAAADTEAMAAQEQPIRATPVVTTRSTTPISARPVVVAQEQQVSLTPQTTSAQVQQAARALVLISLDQPLHELAVVAAADLLAVVALLVALEEQAAEVLDRRPALKTLSQELKTPEVAAEAEEHQLSLRAQEPQAVKES